MTNHYTDVCEETIESLRQQLAQAEINFALEHDDKVELEQQLAAALAACKVKDEALEAELLGADYGRRAMREALAIQPDDSALKAWLGKPVGFSDDNESGITWLAALDLDTPLYAPKGLK